MAKHLSSHKIGDEVGPTGNSSKFAMVFHCSAYASARGWLSMFKRWGIAQLLAVFWATSSMQYCAAPATAAEQPEGGKQTVIRGEIVEKHDLLSDANDPSSPQTPDIEWSHAFTISLSGKNQVSEVWNNTRLSVAGGRGFGRRRGPLATQAENNGSLGDTTRKVVWRILGPKKLQRILPGEHYLMIMDIEIGQDNTCRLDAKYLRQSGFVSIRMPRADTGEMSNFSLPRVEKASCTIE